MENLGLGLGLFAKDGEVFQSWDDDDFDWEAIAAGKGAARAALTSALVVAIKKAVEKRKTDDARKEAD